MLSSRMSLAQNSRPDAWLSGERVGGLRESLRSPRLCVVLNTLSSSSHRSRASDQGCESRASRGTPFDSGMRVPSEPARASRGTPPTTSPSPQRRRLQPSVHTARPNPSRINTSVSSAFFIKSLIMNDLKSNRISKRDNKPFRINTSENYCWKPFRINTSRKYPGEGVGCSPTWGQALLEVCRNSVPGSFASPAESTA